VETLLTADEVAQYLRLNRETVLRKAKKREIPATKDGLQELPIRNEDDFAIFEEIKATNPL